MLHLFFLAPHTAHLLSVSHRPDALGRDTGLPVASLGHTGVHSGRSQRRELCDARTRTLQDGEGKVSETRPPIYGRHTLGAPRHIAER